MDIVLSKKDAEWISTMHPGLKIDKNSKLISGDILVNRSYNGINLSGIFSIKIELYTRLNTILPKVYETSNILGLIAKKLKKSELDIHVNKDKSLCMVISDKEDACFENSFTIQEFFENCIEPYFYWVMYYEKYNKMPWNEYAHRELGFFELYSENELSYEDFVKKFNIFELHSYLLINIKSKCLCGSKKSMESCHPLIYKGISKMQNIRFINTLKMNVSQSFLCSPLTSPIVYSKIS